MACVSVICTVFNKEKYIRKTLETLVTQKTDFDIEIIVADDASTDASGKIIQEYAQKYPKLVKPVFNDKNLGITLNWIEACQRASGKYIARCDGDDLWIDDHKLQKQFDILEKNPQYGICNSDLDMIDENGRVINSLCYRNGVLKPENTFEGLLVSKGFCNPSSWMVRTEIMLEANASIPGDSVDDTFCILLEILKKTALYTIDEALTAYRVLDDSDSHITDIDKMRSRYRRLAESQLTYLDRYPDSDMQAIAKSLIYYQRELEYLRITAKTMDTDVSDVHEEIGRISEERDFYKAQYENVVNSKIWKLSAPLRRILSKR